MCVRVPISQGHFHFILITTLRSTERAVPNFSSRSFLWASVSWLTRWILTSSPFFSDSKFWMATFAAWKNRKKILASMDRPPWIWKRFYRSWNGHHGLEKWFKRTSRSSLRASNFDFHRVSAAFWQSSSNLTFSASDGILLLKAWENSNTDWWWWMVNWTFITLKVEVQTLKVSFKTQKIK